MELALTMLQEPALDQLITGESSFEQLPEVMANLSGQTDDPALPGAAETLCHRIAY